MGQEVQSRRNTGPFLDLFHQRERNGRFKQVPWNSEIETHWDSLVRPDVHCILSFEDNGGL